MNIPLILQKEFPGTEWTLQGDEYEGLEWLDKSIPKPAKSALENLWEKYEYLLYKG